MTSYNDISQTSTSYNDAIAGFGLLCNNEDILCNSQEYLCDGSVVKRDISYTTTSFVDIYKWLSYFNNTKWEVYNSIGSWDSTNEVWDNPGSSDIFYPTTNADDYTWSNQPTFDDKLSYITIGNSSGFLFNAGILFKDVTIVPSSTILTSYTRWYSLATYTTDDCNVNIYFEDVDSAVAPTSRNEAEALVLTDAVAWNGIESYPTGNWFNTPSLNIGLQTIVDRNGFASGNDVQPVFKDNNSSNTHLRSVGTFDTGTYIPELHAEWEYPVIKISVLGGWGVGLRPTLIKLTLSEDDTYTVVLVDTNGDNIISTTCSQYNSLPITWGNYDMERLEITGTASFELSNIEFSFPF